MSKFKIFTLVFAIWFALSGLLTLLNFLGFNDNEYNLSNILYLIINPINAITGSHNLFISLLGGLFLTGLIAYAWIQKIILKIYISLAILIFLTVGVGFNYFQSSRCHDRGMNWRPLSFQCR